MRQFLKGLAVGLACLLCFVLGVIFNTQFLGIQSNKTSDKGLQISQDLYATKELKASFYKAELSFFTSDERIKQNELDPAFKKELDTQMAGISQILKSSELCFGGSYSLRPNYSFTGGLRVQAGWVFESNFTCKFKNEQDFDKTLAKLDSKLLQYSSSKLYKELDFKSKQKAKQALEDELFIKAKKIAANYGQKTKKSCQLKELYFNPGLNLYRTNLPIDDMKSISLSSRASFVCE